MTPLAKAAIIAAVDAGLILALAWNASRDLNRWPRGWADAVISAGTEPGRQYVTLDLMVAVRGAPDDRPTGRCRLEIQDDQAVCRFDPQGNHWFARRSGPGSPRTYSRPYRFRFGDSVDVPAVGARVLAEVAVSPDGRLRVLRIASSPGP